MIRAKMSANSKGKADFLRSLNANEDFVRKRAISRKFHDQVVKAIVDELRARGKRCFILSEYVKERRIPDAIIFDEDKLVAVEIEQEKRYKPSHQALTERLTSMNNLAGFFDRTKVLFISSSKSLADLTKESVAELL